MAQLYRRISFWLGLLGLLLVVVPALLSWWWTPYDAMMIQEDKRLLTPRVEHLLGTDLLGRDLLSRMMVAGRTALVIALGAVGLAFGIGFVLVVMSVVWGRWLGFLARVVMDFILIFPTILFALVMIVIWGNGLGAMILLLGIAMSPRFLKVMLATIHEQQGLEYLLFSQSLGKRGWHLLVYHYLPALWQPMIHTVVTALAMVILSEASLSFLGLGIMPPNPSWGYALSEAKQYFFRYPHLAYAPLAFMVTTILSLNLLGYLFSQERS